MLRRHSLTFVRALQAEPDESDVMFVAESVTGGDVDHARWELRYARRVLGLLTAERDALDDRTGSAVAHAIGESLHSDRHVAPEKRTVATQQLNARLYAYRIALANREAHVPSSTRLARTFLTFGGGAESVGAGVTDRLGTILAGYMMEANEQLRDIFGAAQLPEDVAPSLIQQRASGE
jgi:hypothetical protein